MELSRANPLDSPMLIHAYQHTGCHQSDISAGHACTALFNPYKISAIHEGVYPRDIPKGDYLKN